MGRGKAGELTEVLRGWLVHLEACAASEETMRAYAKRQGLSEHGLYQAAKELRRRGALPAVQRRVRKPAARPSAAARRPRFVEVRAEGSSAGEAGAWRARLPNGVVIEGNAGLGEAVEALSRL